MTDVLETVTSRSSAYTTRRRRCAGGQDAHGGRGAHPPHRAGLSMLRDGACPGAASRCGQGSRVCSAQRAVPGRRNALQPFQSTVRGVHTHAQSDRSTAEQNVLTRCRCIAAGPVNSRQLGQASPRVSSRQALTTWTRCVLPRRLCGVAAAPQECLSGTLSRHCSRQFSANCGTLYLGLQAFWSATKPLWCLRR